jgi:hypothetical protein
MGTILTVHGTYAHIEVPGAGEDSASSGAYWWRPDSPFVNELKGLVSGEDGDVDVVPFVWSGENSERERRRSGHQLYLELLRLEEEGKPYCIVAHSHGGSLVSAALLEAASRRKELPNLKRWITVGTPFVELRRERYLFMRLSLILKAMYVASTMFLVIFLGATVGQFLDGDIDFSNLRRMRRLGISALFSAVPVAVFLMIAVVRERRKRYFKRPQVKARAREIFADRWLAMTHEDDEAVRGLGTLRTISLPIFDKQFAVPFLSLLSVFLLPALYLYAINSPKMMVGLTDLLSTRVYQLDKLEDRAKAYRRARSTFRNIRRGMRDARKISEDTLQPLHERQAARKSIQVQRKALVVERESLNAAFPDLRELQRVVRFKRKFLEDKDKRPCNNGQLCKNGMSLALNAKLLLHLITDEVTNLIVNDETERRTIRRWARFVVPVVLVPVVLGGIAILLVLLVQVVARAFSRLASRWLDKMTWNQIRRAAVGNDTDDEIAVGATPFPEWAGTNRSFLPMRVGSDITSVSNEATFRSVGKFRDALSEFSFLDGGNRKTANNLLAYLNWNELIHTSYFFVPSFTQLVAYSIAESEGFKARESLTEAVTAGEVKAWLSELERPVARVA